MESELLFAFGLVHTPIFFVEERQREGEREKENTFEKLNLGALVEQ